MIYPWCVSCQNRDTKCSSPDSHRAQGKIVWRADFYLGGQYGQRIRKTYPPGITKKEAEKFEALAVADFERGRHLPQIGNKSKTLFPELVRQYIEGYAQHHIKGWKIDYKRIETGLKLWEHRQIGSLQHQDCEEYISERLESKKEKTTINRELTTLKSLMKWAVDNNFLARNPFERIKKFKTDTIRVRWLSDTELRRVLDACDRLNMGQIKDVLLVAFNTGFRRGNLQRLTANDIIGNRIQALKTKSGKSYDVPINRDFALFLKELVTRRPTGPLLDFTDFVRRLTRVLKEAGLWRHDKHPEYVCLHTFRHTFAAHCLKQGIEINMVSKWMGHRSVDFTHERYGHLCPKREESLINLISLNKMVKENVQEAVYE